MTTQEQLLEQYKLYVELMDRVSQRRQHTNQFYLSLISALAGALIIFRNEQAGYEPSLLVTLAVLGMLVSLLWWLTLTSYRQLNQGKFQVIDALEAQLPYACFKEEWNVLGAGKKQSLYRQLTQIERLLPLLVAGICLCALIYFLWTSS